MQTYQIIVVDMSDNNSNFLLLPITHIFLLNLVVIFALAILELEEIGSVRGRLIGPPSQVVDTPPPSHLLGTP